MLNWKIEGDKLHGTGEYGGIYVIEPYPHGFTVKQYRTTVRNAETLQGALQAAQEYEDSVELADDQAKEAADQEDAEEAEARFEAKYRIR